MMVLAIVLVSLLAIHCLRWADARGFGLVLMGLFGIAWRATIVIGVGGIVLGVW